MKVVLAILNILFLVGILLWPLMFYGSIFIFDSPGSAAKSAAQNLALSIWIYPIPALIGNFLFWRSWRKGSIKKLLFCTFMSGFGYLLIVVILAYIEVICDGKFACNSTHENTTAIIVPSPDKKEFIKIEKSLKTYGGGYLKHDYYDSLLWFCSEEDTCRLVDKQNKRMPEFPELLFKEKHHLKYFKTVQKYKVLSVKPKKEYKTSLKKVEKRLKRNKKWDILVSPKSFSLTEYETIVSLISHNREAINKALVVVKEGGDDVELLSSNAKPYLNSIAYIHSVKDSPTSYLSFPDDGVYFLCKDDRYILSLRAPDDIYLSPPKGAKNTHVNSTFVGTINQKEKTAELRAPFPNDQEEYGAHGLDEWFSIYKNCLDGENKSLFSYYKISRWDYKYPKKK